MRPVSTVLSISALTLVGVLALTSPAAASVAALPEGEALYAVDCEETIGLLLGVNSETAEFTAIGTGTVDPKVDCAGPSAYDATTGTAYWISWNGDPSATLMTVDLASGLSTVVADFTEAVTGDAIDAHSIAIDTAGNAFLIGENETDSSPSNMLYSLNLGNAQVTFIADFFIDEEPLERWWSFAYNPADSTFYGVSDFSSADGGGLYAINVATGGLNLIEGWDTLPAEIYGIAFDSDGAMWGFGDVEPIEEGDPDGWGLFVTTVTAPVTDFRFVGITTLDESDYFSESIFIVPAAIKPALAATGVSLDSALPVAGLGVLMLAVGGVAVAIRRRVSTSSTR